MAALDEHQPHLTDAINSFSLALYKVLSEDDVNVFYSPLSISVALAMTLMGCEANTKSQLQDALKLEKFESSKEIQEAYSSLIERYVALMADTSSEFELRLANMLYVSSQMKVKSEFKDCLSERYKASAQEMNFSESDAARTKINGAVSKTTNSKIKELLPDGVINALTQLVLVNAIYFKSEWESRFNLKLTKDRPFWTSTESSVQVPMMSIEAGFRYLEFDDDVKAKLLVMNYKSCGLSMVFVLPEKKDGLQELEEKLLPKLLEGQKFLNVAPKENVQVLLPRFKMEFETSLVDLMKNMGVTDLFDSNKCDLTGIAGSPGDLHVSYGIHKAFIEVNEKGSEAAAASAVVVRKKSGFGSKPAKKKPKTFIADHPFAFFILDSTLNSIVFAGRLIEPTPSESTINAASKDTNKLASFLAKLKK